MISMNQNFIHPEAVLKGLLNNNIESYYHQQQQNKNYERETQDYSLNKLEQNIQVLQHKLDSMNHQVIQAEGLLTQRDTMYNTLDHLRAQRQQIEEKIQCKQYQVNYKEKSNGRGVKQMNQRLKRRIHEVKQYISKMEYQNDKIQQSLQGNNQTFYSENIGGQINHYRNNQMRSANQFYNAHNHSPRNKTTTGMNNSHAKMNHQYFQGLRKRIQGKQEDAWSKVKKQEEEIKLRNARSMINFGRGFETGYGTGYGTNYGGFSRVRQVERQQHPYVTTSTDFGRRIVRQRTNPQYTKYKYY